MGVDITLEDPAWPGRGGITGLLQGSFIFFLWSLPPAIVAASLLLLLLPRIEGMNVGAAALLMILAGAAIQTAILWVEALLAGAGPFPWRDLVPSAIAGASIGLLSLMLRRSRSRRANDA
jgi:hypothetical protein